MSAKKKSQGTPQQQRYAAALIAAGVLADNDPWTDIVEDLAKPKIKQEQQILTQLFG